MSSNKPDNVARAFAPASISLFVKLYKHKNPRWAGSYGVGFTLSQGVIVKVTRFSGTTVVFNKKRVRFPTVAAVIRKLTKEHVNVSISSKLPLGAGFSLSGAAALATAYAVNKLLGLNKSEKALAIIAHTAEVENKTGAGNIVNQYYGGFFFKRKPSSYFIVERIPVFNKYIYCKYFSTFSTASVLSNKFMQEKIDKASTGAMQKTKALLRKKKQIALEDFIPISKTFILQADILRHKKTRETIERIEKNAGIATMLVFGNAVYSDKPFPGAMKLKLSNKGALIL